jgi:hypothetical protein
MQERGSFPFVTAGKFWWLCVITFQKGDPPMFLSGMLELRKKKPIVCQNSKP